MNDLNAQLKERVRLPIPTRELERRWKLVRAGMAEKDLDLLIMQNDNQWLGGYVRYFTDIPPENAFPVTLLFPVDDEMTIVTSGGVPIPLSPPEWALRGIKGRINVPYHRTVNYTDSFDAGAVVQYVKSRNANRVGIVGLGLFSAAFIKYIEQNLPNVEFIDATDLIDEIKAVKSEDEIVYIRKAAQIQDYACAALPAIIRPGKYEYEIRTELVKLLEDMGSEEQLLMLSSAPQGKPAGHANTFFQNRRIEKGDQFFMMIETSGAGGYYAEVGRTWSLGEPSIELLEAWSAALESQKLVVEALRPGAKPGDLLKINNDFLVSKGYKADERVFAHGQGYDMMERPTLRNEEKIIIKPGMNLAIHPTVLTDKAYAFCCDNYLTTEYKPERLHKTPQEVIILD